MPMRRIVQVVKKPFGTNGGHLLVCVLKCGHKVEHLNNHAFKVGKRTRCPECR
jgi:hypothetical protein